MTMHEELPVSAADVPPAVRDNWTFDDCFPADGDGVSRLTRVVVEEVAAACDREAASIWPSTKLVEDLSFKSLDFIELTIRLELEFGIEISERDVAAWTTVGKVVSCVRTLVMIQTAKP